MLWICVVEIQLRDMVYDFASLIGILFIVLIPSLTLSGMTILGMGNRRERFDELFNFLIINWKKKTSFMSLLVLVEGTEMAIWRPFPVLQPSEQNTYADIEAAYKCLEESYGTKQEDIILYGQSVGSGPTLDLAARLPQLRAVVLHSPILSGLRVMYPVKRTYWFDIYKVTCVYQYCCPNQSLKWWFYNLYNIMRLFFVLFFFAEYWQNPTSKLSSSHHACKYTIAMHVEVYIKLSFVLL